VQNPYLPLPATIAQVTLENALRDIKTFKLVFDRDGDLEGFAYLPGQFAELSVFGKGESPIGIASSPTEEGFLLFTVKRAGTVTTALHNSEVGTRMGVRGPLGKPFPWDRLKGKDIVIVSGGFAFTTLRSALVYLTDPRVRGDFGSITAVYGAREPGELLYKDLLGRWGSTEGLHLTLTVDRLPANGSTPAAAAEWSGRVGLVPTILKEVAPASGNAIALVCGPPVMIRFTIPVLVGLGFHKQDIVVSLENRMKCGIGKCGRCNVGPRYVCIDGPVFTYAELEALPVEY